jgi:hypothetical protein
MISDEGANPYGAGRRTKGRVGSAGGIVGEFSSSRGVPENVVVMGDGWGVLRRTYVEIGVSAGRSASNKSR